MGDANGIIDRKGTEELQARGTVGDDSAGVSVEKGRTRAQTMVRRKYGHGSGDSG